MNGPGKQGLLGNDYKPRARNALSGRFLVPPFSVFNAREGFWQDRKRSWISLGIRSELGRGENLLKFSETVTTAPQGELKSPPREPTWGVNDPDEMRNWEKKKAPIVGLTFTGRRRRIGETTAKILLQKKKAPAETFNSGRRGDLSKLAKEKVGSFRTQGKPVYLLPPDEDDEGVLAGTSIFDPVLCEISYRWYCPEGGHVLDPFAGGSVRGIVAGELGLRYTGVDLSATQLDANRKQAAVIGTKPSPVWINGDSRNIKKLTRGIDADTNGYDFIFSCPPYGNLEQYSDDPADISSMSVDDFSDTYFKIIAESCALLKLGRFACFVVGDYRDKKTGFYNNLPAKTIVAFEEAGMLLYNSAILVTAVGSLPMRINRQFLGGRKLGTTHQHVLVFANGNPNEFLKTWPGFLLDKEIGK